MKQNIFFHDFFSLSRVLVIGVLSCALLVVFLRVSGKRILSKMNAFDLVVTVAIGSNLSTTLLDSNISLSESAVSFLVLIGLQFGVAWTAVRMKLFNRLIKSEPQMLFYQGESLKQALIKERVNEPEILQAVRSAGYSSLEDVEAVILETDGTFAVIRKGQSKSALQDVNNPKSADG